MRLPDLVNSTRLRIYKHLPNEYAIDQPDAVSLRALRHRRHLGNFVATHEVLAFIRSHL